MTNNIESSAEYNDLLESIKQTLSSSRARAARTVNNILIETYWEIGKDIAHRREEQGWGARVIERLSADLRAAHPDIRGLSAPNLEYMATLATRWPDGIAQQPVARLPWGQVTVLLDRCTDQLISEFYARRAADEGWSRSVLQAMIASRLHERTQPVLTTFDRTIPEDEREVPLEVAVSYLRGD